MEGAAGALGEAEGGLAAQTCRTRSGEGAVEQRGAASSIDMYNDDVGKKSAINL